MSSLPRLIPAALALAGVVALATPALAKDQADRSDAAIMQAAKISLAQAVATAERQTGGRAFDAGVDNERGRARISVEVATGTGVRTLLIDPATGAIAANRAGGEDQEGGHED